MDADTIGLLKNHTVTEVRDLDLEVSEDAAKLHDEFTQKLRGKYGEILEMTGLIGTFSNRLKKGEIELRDLCFRDDIYKLKKLEPLESPERVNIQQNTDISDENEDIKGILLVSSWSLAVFNFVSTFAFSSSSAKVFDKVIEQFQRLQDYGISPEYEAVVRDKCEQFVRYVLDSYRENRIAFTVEQWARIWSVIIKRHDITRLPWNDEQLLRLDEILYESILEKPLEVLMSDTDEHVSQFVRSPEFEHKLTAKILHDIERQFQLLDELISQQDQEDRTPTFEYPQTLQEVDLPHIVENCRLYSAGLTTHSRVRMYNLVNPLIQMIDDLKAHGGQSDQIAKLRKKLVAILESKMPPTEVQKTEDSSLTMDQVVKCLITRQDNLIASRLIHKQIDALR